MEYEEYMKLQDRITFYKLPNEHLILIDDPNARNTNESIGKIETIKEKTSFILPKNKYGYYGHTSKRSKIVGYNVQLTFKLEDKTVIIGKAFRVGNQVDSYIPSSLPFNLITGITSYAHKDTVFGEIATGYSSSRKALAEAKKWTIEALKTLGV